MTSSDQVANEISIVFPSEAVLTSLNLETVKPAMHFVPVTGQVGSRFGPENIYFNIPDDAPQADAAITTKASELGSLPGGPTSGLQTISGGYRRIFEGCTIYWSRELGAHELHSDILAKYNAVGGPFALGLPKTDETPDGIARFNDFELGSIYWTSHTGPMIVRVAIRDLWLPRRSALGYPVRDDRRVALSTPSSNPSAGPIDPKINWSLFENGAVAGNPGDTEEAVTADVSPELLRRLIQDNFDTRFHQSPRNVGLHPPVETISVSEWKFGDLWTAIPRTIFFACMGFTITVLPQTPILTLKLGSSLRSRGRRRHLRK